MENGFQYIPVVGGQVFEGCKNLRYIKIPVHAVINNDAFAGCQEKITI